MSLHVTLFIIIYFFNLYFLFYHSILNLLKINIYYLIQYFFMKLSQLIA